MFMKKINQRLGCAVLLLLAACQSVAVPTQLPDPSGTSPVPTPTITSSPEPTPTITPTFLPPLPTGTPEEVTLALIHSNHGCRFPCWWGIMPGVTTYPQVTALLEPLIKRPIYITGSPSTLGTLEAEFALAEEYSVLTEARLLIIFRDSIVQAIEVYGFKIPNLYTIGRIMDQYGPPEEILITTVQTDLNLPLPFALFMFYPEQGMYLGYSLGGYSDGQTIQGCFDPSRSGGQRFYFWSPGVTGTVEEVIDLWYWKFELSVFHDLEYATGMTVEAFYEAYRHPAGDGCINTPAEIWPLTP